MMRLIVLLISIMVFLASCAVRQPKAEHSVSPSLEHRSHYDYRASATKHFDLIHTTLHVSFDWSRSELHGSAEITLRPHFYPADSLYLDARGMTIENVFLKKGENTEELAYQYRNDSICIRLDKTYRRDDTLQVTIYYISKPEELETGGSSAITSDKGLYFINADGSEPGKPQQIWTQGEIQSSSVWFPTIDRPNQKMTQEIYITIDTAFTTLSNGILVSSIVNQSNGTRTDYWKQTLPHSPYLVMMAIGKYAVVKDTWRGKEVSYYVEPEYEKYARAIYGKTPLMMEFFSNKLGVDYVWDKYAQVVVRDYVSGAMENTSASVFGEFMQRDDRGLLDRTNEDVISHELIHQWFGDLVTCESWSNITLNESFAVYGEYLWNEHYYGRDEADYAGNNELNNYFRESRNKQVNLMRSQYKRPDDVFDRHSYDKGGRVLHMLRKYTGDEAFFAALNKYLVANKFSSAEIHHLRLAFEEITGEDLNWFFNQWFYDKGHPSLSISYEYDETSSLQRIMVQQLQDPATTPIYKLPVDVDFYTSSGVVRKRISVTQKDETFEFYFPEKPVLVNFDAEKMLLGIKNDKHSKEEWAVMFEKGKLFLDRYEALAALSKTYSQDTKTAAVVRSALNDPHWKIRETALDKAEVSLKNDRASIKTKIIGMASGDPRSEVRSQALQTTVRLYGNDPDVISLLKKSVGDSSYNVMETGVGLLLGQKPGDGFSIIKEMEADPNENIRSMVTGFYVDYGNDSQFDFMTRILEEANGFSKYAGLQTYGKFLMRCNPALVEKGIDIVSESGMNHPQWFVRLSAVQVLSEIASVYGKKSIKNPPLAPPMSPADLERKAMMEEKVRNLAATRVAMIKEKETHPDLMEIYRKKP